MTCPPGARAPSTHQRVVPQLPGTHSARRVQPLQSSGVGHSLPLTLEAPEGASAQLPRWLQSHHSQRPWPPPPQDPIPLAAGWALPRPV